MFATITATTAKNIQATEELINDLQAELEAARQQLARFQQEDQAQLTAKAAAESALESAAKAFKAVAIAYGESGVEEFKQALLALTDDAPEVPVLSASEEVVDDTEPSDEPTVEVAAEVVESVEGAEDVPTAESVKEVSESTAEIVLPSPDAIGTMKKAELVTWLKRCELPSSGSVREMRTRLTAHAMSYYNPRIQAA